MSFEAWSCFVLCCDGCEAAFEEGLHFPSPDPTDEFLVEEAEGCGWTTDGERWHCAHCPELRSTVCRPCRHGLHNRCEGPGCTCELRAPTPGQAALPGLAKEAARA